MTFTPAGSAVVVDAGLTVSDPDGLAITGATVRIGGMAGGDSLNYVTHGGITGAFNAATGVLTLTGTASAAQYQAALDSVTFTTTSTAVTPRTVSFTVTDAAPTNNLSNTSASTLTPTTTTTGTTNSVANKGNIPPHHDEEEVPEFEEFSPSFIPGGTSLLTSFGEAPRFIIPDTTPGPFGIPVGNEEVLPAVQLPAVQVPGVAIGEIGTTAGTAVAAAATGGTELGRHAAPFAPLHLAAGGEHAPALAPHHAPIDAAPFLAAERHAPQADGLPGLAAGHKLAATEPAGKPGLLAQLKAAGRHGFIVERQALLDSLRQRIAV
jgi:hypothetical protein